MHCKYILHIVFLNVFFEEHFYFWENPFCPILFFNSSEVFVLSVLIDKFMSITKSQRFPPVFFWNIYNFGFHLGLLSIFIFLCRVAVKFNFGEGRIRMSIFSPSIIWWKNTVLQFKYLVIYLLKTIDWLFVALLLDLYFPPLIYMNNPYVNVKKFFIVFGKRNQEYQI